MVQLLPKRLTIVIAFPDLPVRPMDEYLRLLLPRDIPGYLDRFRLRGGFRRDSTVTGASNSPSPVMGHYMLISSHLKLLNKGYVVSMTPNRKIINIYLYINVFD